MLNKTDGQNKKKPLNRLKQTLSRITSLPLLKHENKILSLNNLNLLKIFENKPYYLEKCKKIKINK